MQKVLPEKTSSFPDNIITEQIMILINWATQTMLGRILTTFFISMLPIVELRAGLPYGIALGLPYGVALAASVLGNMVPVPFIILFIRRIFAWLRSIFPKCDALITRLEEKAHIKGAVVRKYSTIGLCILVAIPLPGTGAWTGALVAAILDLRLKNAVPTIFLGVIIAAAIMTMLTFGVLNVFG